MGAYVPQHEPDSRRLPLAPAVDERRKHAGYPEQQHRLDCRSTKCSIKASHAIGSTSGPNFRDHAMTSTGNVPFCTVEKCNIEVLGPRSLYPPTAFDKPLLESARDWLWASMLKHALVGPYWSCVTSKQGHSIFGVKGRWPYPWPLRTMSIRQSFLAAIILIHTCELATV